MRVCRKGVGGQRLNAQKGGRVQLGGQKYHQSPLDFTKKGKPGTESLTRKNQSGVNLTERACSKAERKMG